MTPERPPPGTRGRVHPPRDPQCHDHEEDEGGEAHCPGRCQHLDLGVGRLELEREPVGVPPAQPDAEPRVGGPDGHGVLERREALEDRVELVPGLHLALHEVRHEEDERGDEQQHELGPSSIGPRAQDQDEDRRDQTDDRLPRLGEQDSRQHHAHEDEGPPPIDPGPRGPRIDHDRPHRADRAREVLVHAIREARVDRAQVAVRDVYQTFYDGDGRQDGDGADEQAETGAGVTVGADGPSDEKRSGHEHPGVRPLDGVRRVRVVDDRDQRGELVHRRGPEDRTQAGGEGPPGEKKSWDGGRCEGEVREREVDPSAADAEDDEEQG